MKIFAAAICFFHLASFASCDRLRPNSEERRLSRLLANVKKADNEASDRLIKTIKQHQPKKLPKASKPAPKGASKRIFKAIKQHQGLKQLPFDPETDDPEWPGAYPSTSFLSREQLVINIRLDDYPGEMIVRTRTVFPIPDEVETQGLDEFATSKSIKVASVKQKQDDDDRGLVSIPIEDFNDEGALYQIEISDEVGDGICCGTFGYGWITVTNTTKDVLWSVTGNYSYITTAYLWKDSNGDFSVVGEINPGAAKAEETGGSGSGGSGSGTCSLCPSGSSRSPTKEFLFPGENDGDYVNLMCSDLEESIAGWSSTDCADLEAGGELEGFGEYFRALCECPGHAPSCPLCGGEQVVDLEATIPLEGGGEVSCFDADLQFMTLDALDCADWGDDSAGEFSELCGCPGGTLGGGNPPVSSQESCSLCPYGSSGARDKEFELRGSEGYETFTCADFEDSIATWTSSECTDLEEGGDLDYFATYIRAICECPGQGPFCPLCDGGPVADPDEELPIEGEMLTCYDSYLTFQALDAAECADWGDDGAETFTDLCGCA